MRVESRTTSEEALVFLNVLDRFETPQYAKSWEFFKSVAEDCPDWESFHARCPLASDAYTEIDRVLCLYETSASLIRRGALNEDLFFDVIPPASWVWKHAEPWVRGLHEIYHPRVFEIVGWLAAREEEWKHEQGLA